MPLGKREDFGDARYSGVTAGFTRDVITTLQVLDPHENSICKVLNLHAPTLAALQDTGTAGFDFIVTPIRNSDASALVRDADGRFSGLTAADALFVDGDHCNQVQLHSLLSEPAGPSHGADWARAGRGPGQPPRAA